MKKKYGSIATAFALFLFTLSVSAQTDKRVNQKTTGENGLPSLITFSDKSAYKSSDFQQVFKDQLDLKQNQSFSRVKSESDQQGFTHEKFQLYHQGIKVEFATYTLHSANGKLASMSGEYYNINNVNTTPTLSQQAAFNKAVAQIGASHYLWENQKEAQEIGYQKPQGELVLLPSMAQQGEKRATDSFRLAYKFDIYATAPISRGNLYIDAVTGEALFYNATIKHLGEYRHGSSKTIKTQKTVEASNTAFVAASAATRYSGTQSIQTTLSGTSYILFDATKGNGIKTFNLKKSRSYTSAVNFTDVDNNWTATEFNNTNKDNAALDAHWGAEKTYDYWSSVHARNSYNGSGAVINSYVHYSNAYNNAFWDGSRMTYGDGSGTQFDALTSIDVAAHEIGHAVCSSTADLAYQRESGAMNEGFSDIWGACIEYFAAPTKSTWLIGEDIERRPGKLSLRSMSNPKTNNQPDTYQGTNWKNVNCGTPTQANDQCGVHTNSGVLNHWFYILTIGKSGTNDIGSSYNVSGIGIDKAAKIAYRLESVYLTANSTFSNARTSGIQAAIDLYGAGSPEVIATTNAWYAVGVGAAFTGGGSDTISPSAPSSLVASGTTVTTTNLSWTASTDNVGVTGYNVYNGTTLLATVATTNYAVSGLTAATAYTFSIKAKDAAGNVSASSNVVNVTTTEILITYCASKGTIVTDEFIDNVAIGGITNVTAANGGYANFTNLSGNVPYGSNTIVLSVGFRSTTYTEFWGVWIDYNKNGTFETPDEKVVSGSTSSATNLSYTFTVPTTALAGPTRMRVSMKYNAAPTACENFQYGEVEDYTVNIGEAPIAGINADAELGNEANIYDFNVHPNPVENVINVSLLDNRKSTYKIYNYLGKEVKGGNLNQGEINFSNFASGLYIFEINDGQKTLIKKFIKK
jgi:bacillolysin